MTLRQQTLTTARLVLRPFRAADAPQVQALAGLREVADTTLTIPHPYPDGAAESWIASHGPALEAGTHLTWAVTEAADGTLAGAIGLHLSRQHVSGELGYWIRPDRWNRGYATEAAAAVADLAFGALDLNRLEARHFTRNAASGRVMQKLGMTMEGLHRQAICKNGRFEDVALYGLLAAEWLRDDRD